MRLDLCSRAILIQLKCQLKWLTVGTSRSPPGWRERSRGWWWQRGPAAPPRCSPPSGSPCGPPSPRRGSGSPGCGSRAAGGAGSPCWCPAVYRPGTWEPTNSLGVDIFSPAHRGYKWPRLVFSGGWLASPLETGWEAQPSVRNSGVEQLLLSLERSQLRWFIW